MQVVAGQRVLVVGLGASGRAAAALLGRLGALPAVTDDHLLADLDADTAGAMGRPEVVAPSDALAAVAEFDLVVCSPGIPRAHALLAAAVGCGVEVISELELAARHASTPLIAVTGTNGKSTTVTLLAAILRAAGRRVFVGGNLGDPLSNAVAGKGSQDDDRWDCCVVETSSFQLEWVDEFHPRAAAILNLSPDHLDRHGTFEAYRDAKLRIFARMGPDDHAVLNRDESWWRKYAAGIGAPLSTFGSSASAPAGQGAVYDPAARQLRATDGRVVTLGRGAWPRAPYDFANLAAAAELARRIGVGWDAVEEAVASFSGLEHRLRLVATVDGVEFWNDSKATNIGATIASLEALSGAVVLLVGGVAKGASFEALARAVGDHGRVKLVAAFGEAAGGISEALGSVAAVETASGLDGALHLPSSARGRATPSCSLPHARASTSSADMPSAAEHSKRWSPRGPAEWVD